MIAFTGSTGLVGQYTLLELLAHTDCEFICASRHNDFHGLVWDPRVHYVHSDYSYASLSKIFRGAEAIVHLGAAIPESSQADSAFEGECLKGILLAKTIFDICREFHISNIVFSSSMAVYGDKLLNDGILFNEEMPLNPMSIYGAEKASIEHIASYYNLHHGMKIKCLRLGQIYGAISNVKNKFLKACTENCLEKKPIKVFGTGMTS